MCCDWFSDYVLQSVDNRNLTSGLDAIVLFVCLKVRYPIPFLYDFFYKLFQRWLGSYIFTPTRALKVNLYFIKNLQMPRLTTQLCIIVFFLSFKWNSFNLIFRMLWGHHLFPLLLDIICRSLDFHLQRIGMWTCGVSWILRHGLKTFGVQRENVFCFLWV